MKIRKPNRLKNYDYSNSGWYYITICTKDPKKYFGRIENGKMVLNRIGNIVDEFWNKIETLHQNIDLDYYVIMPNHIHGIIIINDVLKGQPQLKYKNVGNAKFAIPTDRTKMELSKLIQQFKRAVSLRVKTINPNSIFKWQHSFYDRIIRNQNELFNIRKYIQQNPLKLSLEEEISNLDI